MTRQYVGAPRQVFSQLNEVERSLPPLRYLKPLLVDTGPISYNSIQMCQVFTAHTILEQRDTACLVMIVFFSRVELPGGGKCA